MCFLSFMYLGEGGGCWRHVGARDYTSLLRDVNTAFHVSVYTQYKTDNKFKCFEWHLQMSNTTNINKDYIDCHNIQNKHYFQKLPASDLTTQVRTCKSPC